MRCHPGCCQELGWTPHTAQHCLSMGLCSGHQSHSCSEQLREALLVCSGLCGNRVGSLGTLKHAFIPVAGLVGEREQVQFTRTDQDNPQTKNNVAAKMELASHP